MDDYAPTEQELKEALEVNRALANRLCVRYADDLVGAGHLAIMQSIKSFDRTKGVKFSTYAWNFIQRDQRRALASIYAPFELPSSIADFPDKREPYQNSAIGNHEFLNTLEWERYSEDDEKEEFDREALEQALAALSPTDRQIIGAYFFNNKTLREVALETGYCYQRVAQKIQAILARLRKRLKHG